MTDSIEYRGKIYTIKDVPEYMYKLRPNCKDILRAYIKKLTDKVRYSKENPENITKWKKKTYKKNAKKICAQTMEYYHNNREHLDTMRKKYQDKNRDKINAYRKQYRETHRDEEREYRKEYYKLHPERKIIQQMIHDTFNAVGKKKFNTTDKMGFDRQGIYTQLTEDAQRLGYKDIQDIKSTGKYHVDHIIAKAKYNLKSHKEMLRCNHPSNLRWLPAKENISKGDKLRPEDIEVIKTLPTEIYPKSWGGVIPV